MPVSRPLPIRRTLGDKLQELGARAPTEIVALEKLVDFLLARLYLEQAPGDRMDGTHP